MLIASNLSVLNKNIKENDGVDTGSQIGSQKNWYLAEVSFLRYIGGVGLAAETWKLENMS